MTLDQVTEICRSAVLLALMISAPVLTVAVLVGLGISIIQAVTQIQDQTVSIIPKIVIMLLTLVYVAPWILTQMVEYSTRVFTEIPNTL
jgi:flagellar biosynthetic protein FliQ